MDFKVDTIIGVESRFVFVPARFRSSCNGKKTQTFNETSHKEFKLEYGETELHIQKISVRQSSS